MKLYLLAAVEAHLVPTLSSYIFSAYRQFNLVQNSAIPISLDGKRTSEEVLESMNALVVETSYVLFYQFLSISLIRRGKIEKFTDDSER